MSDERQTTPRAGPEAGAGRGFQVGIAVLLAVLAAGLFFGWRLTQFSPAEIANATHVQGEANAWRAVQARLKKTHSRDDEIAIYQDFLRDFPPAAPPSRHEADALKALQAINADRAPSTAPVAIPGDAPTGTPGAPRP